MNVSVPVGKREADGLQNHRMVEVPICGGHVFQPLLQQGHPEQGAQAHVQTDLQGRDSTNFLGKPCQCFVTYTVIKCFPMTRWSLPCSSLFLLYWPWAPVGKKNGCVFLTPSLRYLYSLMRTPWAFSSRSSSLSLPSEERCCSPVVTFHLSCPGEAQRWTQHSCGPTNAQL